MIREQKWPNPRGIGASDPRKLDYFPGRGNRRSKIEDVASAILKEHKEGLNSSMLPISPSKGAIGVPALGIRTMIPKKIRESFNVTMRRLREKFEIDGKIFRLKS